MGRVTIDLRKDWAIPELELIGKIMHGSVSFPEALRDMILQQSETMKRQCAGRMQRKWKPEVETLEVRTDSNYAAHDLSDRADHGEAEHTVEVMKMPDTMQVAQLVA